MKIKAKELFGLIAEATKQHLLEADITKVDPMWIGTYAFVQAYNQALAAGLFPRNQKLGVEFSLTDNGFRNGVLLISAYDRPTPRYFKSGHGHDLLHGLTQNSQPHFGTFRGEEAQSTNNKSSFKKKLFNLAFKEIRDKFGIDLFKRFPEVSMNKSLTQEELHKIQIEAIKFLREEDYDAYELFNKHTARTNYFSRITSKGFRRDNPTHAYEEEMGNIVSDALVPYVSGSQPIPPDLFDSLMKSLQNFEEPQDFRTYDHPSNEQTKQKWLTHFQKVLPEFFQLYNASLERLKRTGFGKDQKI